MTYEFIQPENDKSRRSLPIKNWAGPLDEACLTQATNLSRLPVAKGHVALMPDAHGGYGMPIGGVLFTERAVVPYAIGVDIGCGVVFVDLGIKAEDLIREDRFPLVLKQVKDPVALDMMRAVKMALDPKGILNPGKMLG